MSLKREDRQYLLSLKFKRYASKHSRYTHGHDEQRLIVGVYVDDLIIT